MFRDPWKDCKYSINSAKAKDETDKKARGENDKNPNTNN